MLTAITKVVGFNYYVPKECVYSALIVRLYMEVRLFQVTMMTMFTLRIGTFRQSTHQQKRHH